MSVAFGRRHGDHGPRAPALWLRVLVMAGVFIAGALMAWQIVSALQSNHDAAVQAVQHNERHDATLAAEANHAAQLALVASRRAATAQQLANTIAESRYQSCLDTNRRHTATVAALDKLLHQALRANPRQRARVRQSRAGTVTLIDAFLPLRDCSQFKP